MRKVLILEDEENIRSFIVLNLKRAGYTVIEAGSGYEALRKLEREPDIGVAVLDVMLPDIDGFEVCRRIRAGSSKIGVIMLTARTQESDKVNGFMTGADDYVTKPFSPVELIARIDALFRRLGGDRDAVSNLIQYGPFKLDTRSPLLMKNEERIKLSLVEYSVMKLLMQNPGRILTREELLIKVWGREYEGDEKTVDVNIRRLRVKLEEDPNKPVYIKTVWGQGYRWGD